MTNETVPVGCSSGTVMFAHTFPLKPLKTYKKRNWILTLRIDKMPKSYVDPDLL